MFIYFISAGEYDGYDVECLATHKKNFTKAELNQIIETTKKNYIDKGYPIKDYTVDNDKMKEELLNILDKMGFLIVHPVGEIHFGGLRGFSDMWAVTHTVQK